MKILRSTKCTIKFATKAKHKKLREILNEYGRVVTFFIETFWKNTPKKTALLKGIVNLPETWLGFAMRQTAAREAIDLIKGAKENGNKKLRSNKPRHFGRSMRLASTTVDFSKSKTALGFNAWLRLKNIGAGISLSLPIKFHKHYYKLLRRGEQLKSYVISADVINFCFEIETGVKREIKTAIGIDTGISALATLSNGKIFGKDTTQMIARIKRCVHGSNGQRSARYQLRQYMDKTAKLVVVQGDLIVVEKLKNITKNTKRILNFRRRLNKNMRRSIGSWNVRYWLKRLQSATEDNRVTFRSVPAYNTSRTCPTCGHIDGRNREGQVFLCQRCGRAGHADVIAAGNILSRFLTGPYSADCKPKTRAFSCTEHRR